MGIPRHLDLASAVEGQPTEAVVGFVLQKALHGGAMIGLYCPTVPGTLVRFETWKAVRT